MKAGNLDLALEELGQMEDASNQVLLYLGRLKEEIQAHPEQEAAQSDNSSELF